MNSLISVVIPTYKRPIEILGKAIKSVLEQTYTSFEVIIVDDNHTSDPIRKDISTYISSLKDYRIRLVQNETNMGGAQARNTGIAECKGDFIAFLDDDDEWLPNKLLFQIEKFNDKDVGLVYCDSYTINIKNNIEVKRKIRHKRVSGWVFDKLMVENHIGSTSFVIIRRNALDRVGGFDKNLRSLQDYDLWLRISQHYKVDYVPVPLVNYYILDIERISTNMDSKVQGAELVFAKYKDYLMKNPKIMAKKQLKMLPYYYSKIGFFETLAKWYKAVLIYPFNILNLKYLAIILYKFLKEKINSVRSL